jgi:hypothetical protein
MGPKELAAAVVDELMLARDGKPVTRLVLMRGLREYDTKDEQNMGGLCRAAAIDRVCAVLQNAQPNSGDQRPA